MGARVARFWVVVVGLLVAVPAIAVAAPDLAQQLDALAAEHFLPDQPGAAVLVRKGDQVLLRKGYGRASIDPPVAVSADGTFRLGSGTKQFTAVGVMLLVDAGKVSLGDDVRKWVPQYPDHGSLITVEHLLTHTSGIPDYTEQPSFGAQANVDTTHEQLLALFKDLPLEFKPGTKWKYSNSGYYLLGMIIEKASGKSYAEFMTQSIFTPLGMAHTRYGDRGPVLPGGVRGYTGPAAHPRDAKPISLKPPFAAGALISTVDDLDRWERAIASGKLLKKASWQRVFTPMKLADGKPTRYGLGWFLGSYEGHPIQSHPGGITGFSSSILRMPEDRVLVVVLCNSLPPQTPPPVLALALAAAAIGKPIVDPPIAAVAPSLLDGYVGSYARADRPKLTVRRSGDHLTVQAGARPPLEARPASDTTFFVKGMVLRFVFRRDPTSGRVLGLDEHRDDGSVESAERMEQPLPDERPIPPAAAATAARP